ncbi:MAG TPA: hypothetical protein VHG35_14100 [Gemmatimonadales bacterium]|nr:hypothetical protein [Gemmatimonadales bacterium]
MPVGRQSPSTFTASSALAEGSVTGLGIDLGSGHAEMGTVRQGGITISRER